MKKLIFFYSLLVTYVYAAEPVISEAQLLAARSAGNTVYRKCILIPPVTKPQIAICKGLDSAYNSALSALNAPFPLVVSTSPSMYSWSPYDICRYEPSHFVFPPEGFPVCIALPI